MDPDKVGLIAFLITLVYTLIGLPSQIVQNHRRRTMHGISLLMNVVLFFTFSIWSYYGALKSDWYIVGSNVPGLVCIAAILGQFYIFRNAK